MAQLLIRNLDDAIKKELQAIAAMNGRSMAEETRMIIRDAILRSRPEKSMNIADWIRAQRARESDSDTGNAIDELNGYIEELRSSPERPPVNFTQ